MDAFLNGVAVCALSNFAFVVAPCCGSARVTTVPQVVPAQNVAQPLVLPGFARGIAAIAGLAAVGPRRQGRRLSKRSGDISGLSGSDSTVGIQPGDYADYEKLQRRLARGRAPEADLDFKSLVEHQGEYAFVDNSPYILETCNPTLKVGKAILIRPRRFGKSTFGCLWLEFFRGNKELFARLELTAERVPEPGTYVCVHLSLSGASPATFVGFDLMRALNKALVAAGFPQMSPQPPTVSTVLSVFVAALEEAGKKAAIFIDEYDYMAIKSTGEAYQQALSMMETLFTVLKDKATAIPFLFITGSSRIAITGIWSGGNNISDLSYKASMASVLGYTWQQIQQLYSVQLSMLEGLHAMSRDNIKVRMEMMYNDYRFSPDSSESVFNLWAVNRFMETGKFKPHFAISGLSSALVTGTLPMSTVAAMAIPGYEYESDMTDLELWRYSPERASEEFSVVVQLLGAGVLTFAPRDRTWLKVPNEDARCALLNVLPKFARGFNAANFSGMVESGDICGMVKLLQQELKNVATQAAKNAAGAETILEYHLQHAFFALTYSVQRQLKQVNWTVTSEVRTPESDRADFLISLRSGEYHCLEFGRKQGSLRVTVINKLTQAKEQYFDVAAARSATKITVIVWSLQGELLCVAGPYDEPSAKTNIGILELATEEEWQTVEGVSVF